MKVDRKDKRNDEGSSQALSDAGQRLIKLTLRLLPPGLDL
jgi:hypothetical protein